MAIFYQQCSFSHVMMSVVTLRGFIGFTADRVLYTFIYTYMYTYMYHVCMGIAFSFDLGTHERLSRVCARLYHAKTLPPKSPNASL